MLLQPKFPTQGVTTPDLMRYEEQCLAYYETCAPADLPAELQSVLEMIVTARRELHRTLVERKSDEAYRAVTELLHLEAQGAALRRLVGDAPTPAPPSSPKDRRPERRRTARN